MTNENMTTPYRFNEGDVDLPDDWRDESMNIFKGPDSEGYNLVVSRETIPKAVDPKEHVAGRIQAIEENLTKYHERVRAELVLDGQPCTWLEYSWKSPEGMMNQINVMRIVGSTVISFTFTSATDFADSQRSLFRRVLESYRAPASQALPPNG